MSKQLPGERVLKRESALHTWINQATVKVVNLNKELADLRKRYALATQSSSVALRSLIALTNRATDAAERSGRAASDSLIAAKNAANAAKHPTHLSLLIWVEEAQVAAEIASKSAAVATELVHEVLLTARVVAVNEKNVTTIQNSMLSVLIAIRASEAATTATKLAHSVNSLAGSIPLTAH